MDRVFSQCIMGVSALLTKCEQDDTSQVPRRQSIVSILMPLLLESMHSLATVVVIATTSDLWAYEEAAATIRSPPLSSI